MWCCSLVVSKVQSVIGVSYHINQIITVLSVCYTHWACPMSSGETECGRQHQKVVKVRIV